MRKTRESLEPVAENSCLLSEDRDLLSDLVASSFDGLAVFDDEGTLLLANPAFETLLGYKTEEIQSIEQAIELMFSDPERAKRAAGHWKEDIKAAKPPEREFLIRHKDGGQRWCRIQISRMRCGKIAVNGQDVTERKQAEQVQQELRFAVDHAPDAFYRVAPDARILYVNDAACTSLGYSREELLAMTIHDIDPNFPEEDWSTVWAKIRKKGTDTFASVQKTKDGRLVPVEISVRHHTVEGSEIHYAFVRDISRRKKTEADIRGMSQLFKGVLTNIPVVVFRLNADGVFTESLGRGLDRLGLKQNEVVGQSAFDLYPDFSEHFDRVINGGTAVFEAEGESDSKKWYFSTYIFSDPETSGGAMGFALDITDLKAAREELERLAAAVHSAAESIMVTDARGIIRYVNPRFEKMTGYGSDEVLGKNAAILKSGKHDESLYEDMWRTISGGGTWRGHFTNKKKDNTLFEEDAVISPVHDSSGKIINYVAVKRDVTHEWALENQIRQSQKMAAIGQLAHKVTHTFTNVLVTILGNTQLARQRLTEHPDLCHYLDEVLDAANKVSSLTAELLALSHPAPLDLKRLRLDKAILGVEELLRRTLSPDVELVIDTSAKTGKVSVDPTQIQQALVHMSLNAVDAMPDGGTLTIETRPASKEESERLLASIGKEHQHAGGLALLSVRDTGSGITAKAQTRIFEPFYTTKKSDQNPGLGLSTVYSIVDQHKGHITVESRPGEGSTFQIYLPVLE